MNIKLQNIGVIVNADFKLEGLTVVTGLNNSGKTTLGKASYSLFSSVENIRSNSLIDTKNYITNSLSDLFDFLLFYRGRTFSKNNNLPLELNNFMKVFDTTLSKIREAKENDELINTISNFKSFVLKLDIEFLIDLDLFSFKSNRKTTNENRTSSRFKDKLLSELDNVLLVINSDRDLVEYANTRILRQLRVEFNNQILPINNTESNAKIEVYDNDIHYFKVKLSKDRIQDKSFNLSPFKNTFFIDDIYALDKTQDNREVKEREAYYYRSNREEKTRNIAEMTTVMKHNDKLIDFLLKTESNIYNEIENQKAIAPIMSEINKILPNKITIHQGKLVYSDDKLDIRNLATGSKMFALLKLLLEKGLINNSTFLILDEPESHLHPKWQNILAEIIVLLVCKAGVKVLLTTHSPNFLLAIDVFTKKHRIKEKTNFYQSHKIDRGYTFLNINDNISEAYALMSLPFLELEAMM